MTTIPNALDNSNDADTAVAEDVIARIGGVEQEIADRAWELPGCATSFRLDAGEFGAMSHLTDLRLTEDGLLASTVDWIDPGAQISLGFEASGQVARRGEVIACRQDGSVNRIAIRFEQRLAA